ncbi:MAG: DUF177 domain-containing protein [Deltaproteobacteria bacterium]|nr:DUF177 domain-containing protein [Deltaproteobacteria bacterium]
MQKSDFELLIPILSLEEGKRPFSFSVPAGDFPVLGAMEQDGEVLFLSPIEIRIVFHRVDEIYRGEGAVSTRVELQCGRCLEKFEFRLEEELSLLFSHCSGDRRDRSDPEELEITSEEVGLIFFSGEAIDLGAAVQEQLLMALPVRPLCREGCRGLCPWCGADLNRESCRCGEAEVKPQWAPLAGLKLKE